MIIKTEKPCPDCGCYFMEAYQVGDEFEDENNELCVWLEPFICCSRCGKDWDIKVQRKKDTPEQVLRRELLPHSEPYIRPVSMTGRSIKQFTVKIGMKRRK